MRKKLEYAFNLYDADKSGYLDKNEVFEVIASMLDLLGSENTKSETDAIAENCFQTLDISQDGKISRGKFSNPRLFLFKEKVNIFLNFLEEFIEGLLSNYSLRSLMSPFN